MVEMTEVQVGSLAPAFCLPATGKQTVDLESLRGKIVVLYFYPKDNTPACTNEAAAFQAAYDEFVKLGVVVLGISRDSIASHEKFGAKMGLAFPLLSDSDSAICEAYQVLKEKNMYGKKVWGVERSTFIINQEGYITHAFRKVKVDGHIEAVLAAVQTL